jgi:hypothetical protein
MFKCKIDFALIQEVDVKANQIVNSSSSPLEQVSMIHDLGYVSANEHGDYVSKMNMGIKQDYMPSMPSKPRQVGVSPSKETIHGNVLWSNALVDENTTIYPIVNMMTPVKTMLHILQQGHSEGTLSFETLDQTIRNISKDIDATTNKFQTQKWKEPEAAIKAARKIIVKKRTLVIESSSSYDYQVSLPP